jgi:hypothetical protein
MSQSSINPHGVCSNFLIFNFIHDLGVCHLQVLTYRKCPKNILLHVMCNSIIDVGLCAFTEFVGV